MSRPKICSSCPATALPSTIKAVFMSVSSLAIVLPSSGSSWTKAFRANLLGRQVHLNQRVRDRLNQQRGSANVDACALVEGFDLLGQHRGIDSAPVPGPARRRLAGERIERLERSVAGGQPVELVAIDHIVGGAAAVEHPRPPRRKLRRSMA